MDPTAITLGGIELLVLVFGIVEFVKSISKINGPAVNVLAVFVGAVLMTSHEMAGLYPVAAPWIELAVRILAVALAAAGVWLAQQDLQSAQAAGDRSAEAWALHQLGTRAIGSNTAQAIDLLKQALSVRPIGETTAAAYTQHNLDMLIPPPLPPKGREGSIGPAGMSTRETPGRSSCSARSP